MHLLNVEKANYEKEFDDFVKKSHKTLSLIHKSSYSRQSRQGRKAADAAFWFASAGVSDSELFDKSSQYCLPNSLDLHSEGTLLAL